MITMQNKSFLKWAGGKSKLMDTLKPHFCKGNRFIEPFFGAGNVSLNVNYEEYIVNDANPDLIDLWKQLKKEGEGFINYCQTFFEGQEGFTEEQAKENYYKNRDTFNTTDDKRKKSALFLYMNKFGFNGMCRYGKNNKFNIPWGQKGFNAKNKVVGFPDKEMITCYNKIKNFQFFNLDFTDIFSMIKRGDVVYCDPPYYNISKSGAKSFTKYSQKDFSEEQQLQLAKCCREAADKGACVIVSNSGADEIQEIYRSYGGDIHYVNVKRSLNPQYKGGTGKVKETITVFNNLKLPITFYGNDYY